MDLTAFIIIYMSFGIPTKNTCIIGAEIVAHILRAVNGSGGSTRTAIMYKAFLSYAQMKEYLHS
jgi:hypothetical protein